MHNLEEIIVAAGQLSPEDRHRLIAALESMSRPGPPRNAAADRVLQEAREASVEYQVGVAQALSLAAIQKRIRQAGAGTSR